jgi:hypothetical protein
VADVGLKALGMDHGNPTIPGTTVWFCSDEHVTFAPDEPGLVRVGNRVRVLPARVDPTVVGIISLSWRPDSKRRDEAELRQLLRTATPWGPRLAQHPE